MDEKEEHDEVSRTTEKYKSSEQELRTDEELIERKTDRHTDRQTDRPTDRQTDRQTNRQRNAIRCNE